MSVSFTFVFSFFVCFFLFCVCCQKVTLSKKEFKNRLGAFVPSNDVDLKTSVKFNKWTVVKLWSFKLALHQKLDVSSSRYSSCYLTNLDENQLDFTKNLFLFLILVMMQMIVIFEENLKKKRFAVNPPPSHSSFCFCFFFILVFSSK